MDALATSLLQSRHPIFVLKFVQFEFMSRESSVLADIALERFSLLEIDGKNGLGENSGLVANGWTACAQNFDCKGINKVDGWCFCLDS